MDQRVWECCQVQGALRGKSRSFIDGLENWLTRLQHFRKTASSSQTREPYSTFCKDIDGDSRQSFVPVVCSLLVSAVLVSFPVSPYQ